MRGLPHLSHRALLGRARSFCPSCCSRHAGTVEPPKSSTQEFREKLSRETRIAILGGGITGLSAAYYLSRMLPNARITVYEASDRWGGWLRSSQMQYQGRNIVFEHGPHTLRLAKQPHARIVMDMLENLGLGSSILPIPSQYAKGAGRYVYYPDRLVPLPASLNPFDIQRACHDLDISLSELFRKDRGAGPKLIGQDESVASFIERQLSSDVVDKLLSPMIHGIYAGDVDQLSATALMPALVAQDRAYGSIFKGQAHQLFKSSRGKSTLWRGDARLDNFYASFRQIWGRPQEVQSTMAPYKVFGLAEGLESLATRLVIYLSAQPNVRMIKSTEVTRIARLRKHVTQSTDQEQPPKDSLKLRIFTKNDTQGQAVEHVLSTIPSRKLLAVFDKPGTIVIPAEVRDALSQPCVDVMVVNLFFANPDLLPAHGFGYLIPRAIELEQNPEGALGVLFDSDILPGQDGVRGTKLTVMLGGHQWSHLLSLPDNKEGIAMARRILQRHLHITDEPVLAKARLQRQCIPQYTLGHRERMACLKLWLSDAFDNRIAVAGCSYNGVSVPDCIADGFQSAACIVGEAGEFRLSYWGWACFDYLYMNDKARQQLKAYGELFFEYGANEPSEKQST